MDDVTEVVQFGGWNRIAPLDDLSVRTLETDDATIGRIGRKWIEAGGADVPTDRL
jgi:hypothetical protein